MGGSRRACGKSLKKKKTRWGAWVGSITYLLKLEGYCIALEKPRRQTLLTSFCDNIVNHEGKDFFKRYLFHVHYIMPYILIQVNEATSSPSWWSDWKWGIS
jgi:hypothetical protein